jgi:hypothetical protein
LHPTVSKPSKGGQRSPSLSRWPHRSLEPMKSPLAPLLLSLEMLSLEMLLLLLLPATSAQVLTDDVGASPHRRDDVVRVRCI